MCFREKHKASDFENTNIEDCVVRSVRKEEIPICFDFRVAGVGNSRFFAFLLSALSLYGGRECVADGIEREMI